uniref:Tetratricopeptide repeat protein 17 n=1 Tax=Dendroctonus ponderosae TaxID=77166 RepID=A0AAR5PKX7_DENPD
MNTLPKIPVNFLVIFYIMCFEAVVSNSRTSTLWTLNKDRTRVIPGEPDQIGCSARPGDSLFALVASTQRYGGAWVRRSPHCQARHNQSPPEHELDCGKPANATFYDSLAGVMDRGKHPPLVEPEAIGEFVKKYKLNMGKTVDLELVESKLRQAKKEKPRAVATWHQLGNFWRTKGDPRRAIECFRKALSVAPHHPEVLLSLAKVLFRLQYLDDAIFLTRRSLEVVPPEKGAWQQYFTLGEIFKAYGHYQEAEVHFRHTLDLQPGYEPALKLLKELEEMPLSPWQSYTYFIIGSLVVVVLLFLNNLERPAPNGCSRAQRPQKSLWSGRRHKKPAPT